MEQRKIKLEIYLKLLIKIGQEPKNQMNAILILTEGNSAKIYGSFWIILLFKYGVFPLKGKVMNVKDSTQTDYEK